MAELVSAGLVRRIGLSEVDVYQAAAAHAIHPVAAIQSELSLWSRDPLGDDDSANIAGASPQAHREALGRMSSAGIELSGPVSRRADDG